MTPGDMGGEDGDRGANGGAGGAGGVGRQTSHPASFALLSEDHVKALLPSGTLLGPVVPLYVTPFTISLSKDNSVLKAVALRRKPTAGLSGVIVHDWLSP